VSRKYPGGFVTAAAPAGYSVYFDGTGDYLSLSSQTAFNVSGGNWTIEMWVYCPSTPSTTILAENNSNGLGGWSIQFTSGAAVVFYVNSTIITSSSTITAGQWTHIALVRNGSTTTLYLNGVSNGTSATDAGSTNGGLWIGARSGGSYVLNGYISNFRIVKGTALYTAAFTPPTQLFNITNTSLLTCNSPAIVDQSSNAFAITANGDAKVSTFTPFTAYVPAPTGFNPALGAAAPGIWTLDQAEYFTANRLWPIYDPYYRYTTLMLPGNGTNGSQNNTFLDSSSNNFSITRNGNTTQGTFTPFSQTGWSNYFTASDCLLGTYGANVNVTSSNTWTVECEFYAVSFPTQYTTLISRGDNGTGNTGRQWALQINTSGSGNNVGFYYNNAGADNSIYSTGVVVTLNTWHHIAVSSNAGSVSVYFDGNRVATGTISGTNASTANARICNFMDYTSGTTAACNFNGYVSNLRFVAGTALYSGTTITVPTSPLTAISGTALLTCQSNRFIDNSSNAFTITVSGSPSVQAFSPFAPTAAYSASTNGGSGYFDGTGDGVAFLTSSAQFGISGDFTIECWFYPTAANTAYNAIFVFTDTTSADNPSFSLHYDGSYNLFWLNNGAGGNGFNTGNGVQMTRNAWNYIVITRESGTPKCWLNGVLRVNGWSASGIDANKRYMYVGTARVSDSVGGYMSGYRFVNGTAVYTGTGNITLPTAPLTAITNTVALMQFTNAGITDATAKNDLETVGNAQISTTQSKFGGSSMYFNGTNSYLYKPADQNVKFGTGNFTIECWVYIGASYPAVTAGIVCADSGFNPMYFPGSSGTVEAGNWGVAGIVTSSTAVTLNSWNHLALVRNGNTFTMYVNGTGTSATYSSAADMNSLKIGVSPATVYFNGYIDDLRITKGVARYTANFTPPTSALQLQ
jgi:hypothetical protein